MKKFFEMPVVEITVFDVEDVITTSVTEIDTLQAQNAAEVEALMAKINDATIANVNYQNYSTGSYNW